MNRQQIDALVKQMNVDTAKGPVDERIQQVVVRLLGDLFQAIEDLDIQPSEVWKGLEYLTDAGQANELGLLAAGLGLEHYSTCVPMRQMPRPVLLAALPYHRRPALCGRCP